MTPASAVDNMIGHQVRTWDVLDPDVLNVMRQIPRDQFVPPGFANLAFADTEIPLAHGEFMLAPKVEGRLLQALAIETRDTILEIGTGTGFLTACLAALGGRVVSCERESDLSAQAADRLRSLSRHRNVELLTMDISSELPAGEFDLIAVGGSMPAIDPRLIAITKPGGRLFIVVGTAPVMEARLITKTSTTAWREEVLFETVLKPLRGYEAAAEFVF